MEWMEDAEVGACAGNIQIFVDSDIFSRGTVVHTFRGFNMAFLLCVAINGCKCGNGRKA